MPDWATFIAAGNQPFVFSPFVVAAENIVWLDFSDNTTTFQDTSATTVASANSDPIGRVNDKSGFGLNVHQSSNALRPLLVPGETNSRNVCNFFFGTAGILNFSQSAFDSLSLLEAEAFIVCRVDLDPPLDAADSGIWNFGTDQVNPVSHYPFTDSIIYDGFCSTVRKKTINPTTDLAITYRVYNPSAGVSVWSSRVNSEVVQANTDNTFSISTSCTLGGTTLGLGRYFKGQICEFLLYANTLNATDRTTILTGLQRKWGLL